MLLRVRLVQRFRAFLLLRVRLVRRFRASHLLRVLLILKVLRIRHFRVLFLNHLLLLSFPFLLRLLVVLAEVLVVVCDRFPYLSLHFRGHL